MIKEVTIMRWIVMRMTTTTNDDDDKSGQRME